MAVSTLLLAWSLWVAGAEASPPAAVAGDTPAALEPPVLRGSALVAYPEGEPVAGQRVVVRVRLGVDAEGRVASVSLVSSGGARFDQAVLDAARSFVFTPAQLRGEPVPVEIDFEQVFEPPAAPAAAPAAIKGEVLERGTRRPVMATVAIRQGDTEMVVESDGGGAFRAEPLAPGPIEVRIAAVGFLRFVQKEQLEPGQVLTVRYLVESDGADPYETVVVTQAAREEVSRVSLSGREIHHLPGTFGDPFRIVSALPSMSDASVLVPVTMTRGTSPAHTGVLLDGVELPMLYHLLIGPAVVHPELISRVDVYAGAFPAALGGYTAGMINGVTTGQRQATARYELDLTVAQAGGFVRQPLEALGATVTAAARIGYPGLVMGVVSDDTSLSYWDYQARGEGGRRELGWSLMVLGARDRLRRLSDQRWDPETRLPLPRQWRTDLDLGFHRADLRGWAETGRLRGEITLVADTERAELLGISRRADLLAPQVEVAFTAAERLVLRAGLQASWRALDTTVDPKVEADSALARALRGVFSSGRGTLSDDGAWSELVWHASDDLRLVAGARGERHHSRFGDLWSFDPRLQSRLRILDTETLGAWLEASVGWFHQPPRSFLPVPGGSLPAAHEGLSSSLSSALAVDVEVARLFEVKVEGYYDVLDPIYGEPGFNQPYRTVQQPPNTPESTLETDWTGGTVAAGPRVGRAYGLEVLLRRRDRGDWFGWLSYALARSERRIEGAWEAFDFDVRHRGTLVLGVRLPRGWEVATRVSASSGYPVTTVFGYDEGNLPPELRIDLRIDKRAVWNDWLLDFYIDIVNAAANDQTLLPGERSTARFLLPTLGMRAVL